MKLEKFLVIAAMGIWYAVALTAAPKAFTSHRVEAVQAGTSPAQSCADLNIRFGDRETVMQSEERTIS